MWQEKEFELDCFIFCAVERAFLITDSLQLFLLPLSECCDCHKPLGWTHADNIQTIINYFSWKSLSNKMAFMREVLISYFDRALMRSLYLSENFVPQCHILMSQEYQNPNVASLCDNLQVFGWGTIHLMHCFMCQSIVYAVRAHQNTQRCCCSALWFS